MNLATRLIEAATGGYFLIVKIQQRTGPPHMVTSYGENRHYVRRGFQTVPMEQHEIEQTYRTVASVEGRFLTLLRQVSVIPPIRDVSSGVLSLVRHGNIEPTWISLIAVPLHAADDLIRVNEAERSYYLEQIHIADGGQPYTTMRIDNDGLSGDFTDRDGALRIRTRLYRNGVVEAGQPSAFMRGPNEIPAGGLADPVITRLRLFGAIYDQVGYRGPIRVVFSVDNTANSDLLVDFPHREIHDPPAPPSQVQYSWDTSVDRLLSAGRDEIRPALDRLWQAFGYPSVPDAYLPQLEQG